MKKPIVFLGMLLLSMVSQVDLKQTKSQKPNQKHLQKLKKLANQNSLQNHSSLSKPKNHDNQKSQPDLKNKTLQNLKQNPKSEQNQKAHDKSLSKLTKQDSSNKIKDVVKSNKNTKKDTKTKINTKTKQNNDSEDEDEDKKKRINTKEDNFESKRNKRLNSNKKLKNQTDSEESDDEKSKDNKPAKLLKHKKSHDRDQNKDQKRINSKGKDKNVKQNRQKQDQSKIKEKDRKKADKVQRKQKITGKQQRRNNGKDKSNEKNRQDQRENKNSDNKESKQLKRRSDRKQSKAQKSARDDKVSDKKHKKGSKQDIEPKALNPNDFKQLTKKLTIIDTRPSAQDGLIKGSYWFADQSIIKKWIGMVLHKDSEYLLVTEKGKQQQTVKMFRSLGYKNIKGINGFDLKNFSGQKNVPAIRHKKELESEECFNLNVKSKKECKGSKQRKERRENSLVIPLQDLEERVNELKGKENIVINCKDQNQAKVAYSILAKKGIYCYVLSESSQQLNGLGYTIVKY